jgi:flagellar biosynthetic protein FliP
LKGSCWLLSVIIGLVLATVVCFLPEVAMATPSGASGGLALPTVELKMSNAGSPQALSQGLQLLILMTVLTLAPSILMLATCFTRIVIVLSMVRQAIGVPTLPPSQIIVGLALILSFYVMAPTFAKIQTEALKPYFKGEISQPDMFQRAAEPLRLFMFRQTQSQDLSLFVSLAKLPRPKSTKEVPTHVLLPAFIISELKTAFELSFILFLPFLVIDVVVSSILVSMGMMFLPPVTIALPFKLILFVLVDGWQLICRSLVLGYQTP